MDEATMDQNTRTILKPHCEIFAKLNTYDVSKMWVRWSDAEFKIKDCTDSADESELCSYGLAYIEKDEVFSTRLDHDWRSYDEKVEFAKDSGSYCLVKGTGSKNDVNDLVYSERPK
eukprot:tig00020961_g16769.t1